MTKITARPRPVSALILSPFNLSPILPTRTAPLPPPLPLLGSKRATTPPLLPSPRISPQRVAPLPPAHATSRSKWDGAIIQWHHVKTQNAQLRGHRYITKKKIRDRDMVVANAAEKACNAYNAAKTEAAAQRTYAAIARKKAAEAEKACNTAEQAYNAAEKKKTARQTFTAMFEAETSIDNNVRTITNTSIENLHEVIEDAVTDISSVLAANDVDIDEIDTIVDEAVRSINVVINNALDTIVVNTTATAVATAVATNVDLAEIPHDAINLADENITENTDMLVNLTMKHITTVINNIVSDVNNAYLNGSYHANGVIIKIAMDDIGAIISNAVSKSANHTVRCVQQTGATAVDPTNDAGMYI